MFFKNIVGQEDIKKRLIKSVKDNRISHAQMFLGPEGCGSLPLAIAYAQFISCEDRKEDDSCGVCRSCIKYQKLVHPDLHFIFPVNTAKDIKSKPVSDNFITEWREAVLENAYLNPNDWYKKIEIEKKQGLINVTESESIIHKLNLKAYESEYKIMIIWMPEKMNDKAANKLLKIIEEPPEKTFFILVAENHFQIIQTIVSRTQIIKINKISDNEIRNYLTENYRDLGREEVDQLVFLSHGNLNHVLKNIGLTDNAEFSGFMNWMRICYAGDTVKIVEFSKEMSKNTRDKQKLFLNSALNYIRESFLINIDENLNRLSAQEKDFIKKFSQFIRLNNGPLMVDEISKAIYHVERNIYSSMVFLDLSLKVRRLLKLK